LLDSLLQENMDVRKDNAQKRILCDTVKFLEDYEWIFNFKVTHILQDEIVDNIPVEWFEYLSDLDIDNFDSVFLDLNADTGQEPIFVKEFLGTYRSVQKYFDQKSVIKKVSWKHHSNRKENRKISLKKQHEISNFSKYIANKVPTNLKIVDIGSGLGYIGEELTKLGYDVTGVETSCDHVSRANDRKQVASHHSFNTIQLNVDNSDKSVADLLSCAKASANLCLIGLHCCGDLTCNILKMFASNSEFESVAVVSCCYHKMTLCSEISQFPMSSQVKLSLQSCNMLPTKLFTKFTMRLAAQENIVKWKNQTKEDHLKHMKNVCYRAVLEKVSNDNCLKLVKKKRKGILQSDTEDVEKYLESLSERFLLPDCLIEKFKSDFKICYDENLKHFHLFEVLTGLQFMLQSVIENLIIFDRLLYLQEFCSLSECEIAEIFDPSISPRNKVIFARKNR